MRFTSQQDYNLMLHFNRELINTFIDVPVVLYKLNILESKSNIYGESTSKRWYQGVQVPCLVNTQFNTPVKDGQTVNIEQVSEFNFLRDELKSRDVYPEIGDIIDYNNLYFEISQLNEIQLVAGQVTYNHAIVASAHLTRTSGLQLEPPVT
jgi:hypothetical protein